MYDSMLFQPGNIGTLRLANRLVMGPMGHGFCDETDGFINDRIIEFFRRRARGGVGLIDVGAIQIDPTLYTNEGILKLYDDEFIPGMRRLTDAVHSEGGKIMGQLLHQGRYCTSRDYNGQVGVAPSAVFSRYTGETPREMSLAEVEQMIEYYRLAAGRIVAAGFDAVEISTNSGYLIGQFLSPVTNLRMDKYGGSTLEERMTFVLEVIAAVRSAVGSQFPISLRICSSDYVAGSNTNAEACKVAAAAEKAGVNAIHVTGGWHEATVPQVTMDVPHGLVAYCGKNIKEAVGIPVILCNRMDIQTAERLIYEGVTDFVAMARPCLADPEIFRKAKAGLYDQIRPCVGCNQGCLDMRMKHQKISCLVNAEVGREIDLQIDGKLPLERRTDRPEKILVVGAGPAGMEFARVCAARGHSVTLWEKKPFSGGQIEVNSAPPGRQDFARFGKYLLAECRRLGVDFHFDTEATADRILELCEAGVFDRVAIATGAAPVMPKIPATGSAQVVQAWDVLRAKVSLGKRVVIVGGGAVGVETAEYVAKMGTLTPKANQFLSLYDAETPETLKRLMTHGTKEVCLIEMGPKLGVDLGATIRWSMLARLKKYGVNSLKNTRVTGIGENCVTVTDADGAAQSIPADTVILAVGSRSVNGLYTELEGKIAKLTLLGDAIKPAFIIDAVRCAYDSACAL